MTSLGSQLAMGRLEITRLETEREFLYMRRDAMDLNVYCSESEKADVDRQIDQQSSQINQLREDNARLNAALLHEENAHLEAAISRLIAEGPAIHQRGIYQVNFFRRFLFTRLENMPARQRVTVVGRRDSESEEDYDSNSGDTSYGEEYEETLEEAWQRKLDGIPDFSLGCVKGETWGTVYNLETQFKA